MNIDTPLIEYLIIGAQTISWIWIIGMKILNIPLRHLENIDAPKAFLLIPIVYLLGMIVDDLVFHPLNSQRKKIQEKIYDSEICKDEMIAFESDALYSAYESRVRRVRIIGAAIFNFPLLGISILFHLGFKNLTLSGLIIFISFILCVTSFLTWKNLYSRAYKFRKNAWEIIMNEKKKKKKKKTAKKI